MESVDIMKLYEQGYSIDYIIKKIYLAKIKENKVINARTKKIILIENTIPKKDVSGHVYKIIYKNLKEKNRVI